MPTTNFYLKSPNLGEETLIYLYFSFGQSKPLKYSTGEKIKPEDWNFDKQRIREKRNVNTSVQKNIWLNKVEKSILEVHKRLQNDDQKITVELLRDELDYELGRKERKKKLSLFEYLKETVDFKTETKSKDKSKYKRLYELMQSYCADKNTKLDFGDMTLDFKDKFKTYLEGVEYAEGKLYRQGSIAVLFDMLRTLLKNAVQLGYNQYFYFSDRGFGVPKFKTRHYALSELELDAMLKLDLSGYAKSWGNVRDLFIIGAYTGLRFSDFSQIKKESIQNGFIYKKTTKTGANVIIPVHPVVAEILKKYGGWIPKIYDIYWYDRILPEIAKLAGIDKMVVINEIIGGKKIERIVPKYELIKTHTARRSAATNMLKAGIDREKVKLITGHESNDAFERYIDINEEENAKELAEHPFFKKK